MSEKENKRKKRLDKVHYDAAFRLRLVCLGGDYATNIQQSIRMRLTKLCRESGFERAGMREDQAYLEAIRRLAETTGTDDSPTAARLRERLDYWTRRGREDSAARPATAAAPAGDETVTCECAGSASPELYRSLGLRPGDSFDAPPLRDPAPRQIVIAISKGGWGGGRFVGFEDFTDDETGKVLGPGACLDVPGVGEQVLRLTTPDNPEGYALHRLDDATIRPAETEAARKIAALRARLDRLAGNDEITDCTARINLERQIFAIEQAEANRGVDEWEGFDLVKG